MDLKEKNMLLVATTMKLQQGDRFEELPPYVKFMGEFQIDPRQVPALGDRIRLWFQEGGIKFVSLGEPVPDEHAREVEGLDRGPWFGLQAFINSHGSLRPEDERFGNIVPRFVPGRSGPSFRGMIALNSVALFSKQPTGLCPIHVEQAAQLGKNGDQETA